MVDKTGCIAFCDRKGKVKTMKKIMTIKCNPYFCEAYYDRSAKCNPFKLYKVYSAPGRDGYITKHKKLIVSYADFASILFHISDEIRGKETGSEPIF